MRTTSLLLAWSAQQSGFQPCGLANSLMEAFLSSKIFTMSQSPKDAANIKGVLAPASCANAKTANYTECSMQPEDPATLWLLAVHLCTMRKEGLHCVVVPALRRLYRIRRCIVISDHIHAPSNHAKSYIGADGSCATMTLSYLNTPNG